MKAFMRKMLEKRIVRFGITGALASLTHIVVAFTWLYFLGSSVFIANMFGFSCAFGLSYLLQSHFVFQRTLSIENAKRFFIVQFSALMVSQLFSSLFQEGNHYARVLIVVFMIPLVTYLIHRCWTYKGSKNRQQ
ncbi:polysaccharide synthesis protein GtrA [Enterovibrio norvegicus]|uniref:GtrA family protein n=1 Tax=Enterovibrio norvegicus TaxID=188144 RepID=UPI0002EF0762|nr:GtrA family protein [Enterovibrio norvegicus]OEF60326.1 polysaccharide synthesis protein GtrA [Enterovibrio norvegicus]